MSGVSGQASANVPVEGGAGSGGGSSANARVGMAALTVGALGVVFGDIGTSPLYALQAVFTADHRAVRATPGEVYGVISLVSGRSR
jgi:KUP system potassium uptake protein